MGEKIRKDKLVLLPALILLLSTYLYSQTMGNAALSGTVTDPSHAVIPNAKVTVTQQGTGVTRAVSTNAAGVFNVPSLPPAAYTVRVQAPGFKEFVESITLLADQARAVNIELQVGASEQTVTVQATGATVNTVSPTLSQVVNEAQVMNLPLLGRNAANLTLLVPGTTNANGHGTQQGTTKQLPDTTSISVNGARTDQIAYNLDGADNQDLLSNTNDPFPFPDAVQEFSVQTSNFSAQYGENAGAVVNVSRSPARINGMATLLNSCVTRSSMPAISSRPKWILSSKINSAAPLGDPSKRIIALSFSVISARPSRPHLGGKTQ